MNVQTNYSTQFKILSRAVGYKSVPDLTVAVTYHIVDAPNDFLPDFLGETKPVVVFTQFELDPNVRAKIVNEYDGAIAHLQSLIKEVILFGSPYQGYTIVKEIKKKGD